MIEEDARRDWQRKQRSRADSTWLLVCVIASIATVGAVCAVWLG